MRKFSKLIANSAMIVAASSMAIIAVVQPACWGIFHEPEAPNE